MRKFQQYKRFLREMSARDLDETFHSLLVEEQLQFVDGEKQE